ncbi:MAG: glycosyltransferase family 4 protein, partial [Parcubacteria group bacterium]
PHRDLQIPRVTVVRFGFPWLDATFRPSHILHGLRYFIFPLWWALFQITACVIIVKQLMTLQNIRLFYAYEVIAVPVMKVISIFFRRPLVTRFQGTILFPMLSHPLSYLKQFHHYCALKIPADLVIMANDGTRGNEVLHQLHNRSKKIEFWINGVTPPPLASDSAVREVRSTLGIPDNAKILLTVSRLVGWKRVDRAIRALVGLHDPDAFLIIVGDGDERKRLEGMARGLGVSRRVLFTGSLNHEILGTYYALADVFLSLYSLSNVGNPLLEAMSVGKAIITLDNGDTRVFIKHLVTGILLHEDDNDSLVVSIRQLLNDKKIRHSLATAAHMYAQQHLWTWEQRMKQEQEEINLLLN